MLLPRIKFVLLLVLISTTAFAQKDEKQLSINFAEHFKNAQYHEMYLMFDTMLTHKISESVLKTSMDGLIKQVGVIDSYTFIKVEKDDKFNKTYTECHFKNSTLDIELAFNSAQLIIGFHLVPPAQANSSKYTPPSYDSAKNYTEHQITVTTGEYKMPGVLTVPKNVKNPPVVIFVQGSGPNDKDESYGPNKTFRDLAIGLANKGIATIRYDKRTFIYHSHFSKNLHDATVKDESVDDAISAVKMVGKLGRLNNDSDISGVTGLKTFFNLGLDSNRIYVLGHSLGAMLASRIAQGSKKIKGIVMMAGDSRLLEDVMIEQYKYLASLDTAAARHNQQNMEEMVKQVEYAKRPDLKPDAPDSLLPYNVSAPYWIDINHYNQIKTAQELTIPILLVQGERDYQVTMTDYNLWKDKLGKKKNVTFHSYPKLNHLFLEGEGKSTPTEYDKPGHVPLYVINDIANWVNKK